MANHPYGLYLTEPVGHTFVDAQVTGADIQSNEMVGTLRRVRLLSPRGGTVRWRVSYRAETR